ncbi:MAG: nitroreductase family deazaflavin-dependent oxidoreductase [Solirubrobacteraceae bacterium]
MTAPGANFNEQVIEEFRANEGRVGGRFEGRELLLLHHTGARSGAEYVNPLACARDGERYVVFASAGGRPRNPGWYHNLLAHPHTTIEVGTETVAVSASVAAPDERERLYRVQAERQPQFAEYQRSTDRTIPVVILTPS